MPRLIIALIVALATSTGLVYAGHDATPGSPLYGVKSLLNQAPAGTEQETTTQNAPQQTPEADQNEVDAHQPVTKTAHIKASKPVTETAEATETEEAGQSVSQAIAAVGGTLGSQLSTSLSDVESMKSDFPGESFLGLEAKLRAAADAIHNGDQSTADHILNAFTHELDAMFRSHHLTFDQYNKLYNDYKTLVSDLGISASPLPELSATPQSGKPSSVPPAGRGRH